LGFLFIIPAKAGRFFGLAAQAKMDAGLRRHDKPSLHLKPALSNVEGARDFNHPRERH
jgi:hypothetical protein